MEHAKRPWYRRPLPLVLALLLVLVVGYVAYGAFAPKQTTHVDQQLEASETRMLLASGTFTGAGDGVHDVSGQVSLYEEDGAHLLYFEDYDATSGPDVYFFLTTDPAGHYEAGEIVRIRVPGGAEDGQATLRGTFSVPVPDDVDVSLYRGLSVWCDDFNVEFGSAGLA